MGPNEVARNCIQSVLKLSIVITFFTSLWTFEINKRPAGYYFWLGASRSCSGSQKFAAKSSNWTKNVVGKTSTRRMSCLLYREWDSLFGIQCEAFFWLPGTNHGTNVRLFFYVLGKTTASELSRIQYQVESEVKYPDKGYTKFST